MKKIIAIILLVLFTLTSAVVSGCGGSSDEIVIWTFTDELKDMINNYYLPEHSNAKIKVSIIPFDSLSGKLLTAMENQKGLPDMVALEAGVVIDYVEKNQLLPLNDIVNEGITDNMYDYTKDVVTNSKNEVVGLAWQATPGAFFYRSDMASNILSVSTPEEMQQKISTWQGFLEVAEILAQNGIHILSSLDEPVKVYLANRENAWIDANNAFVIDEALVSEPENYNCLDLLKRLQTGKNNFCYVNQSEERSSTWFNDMKSDSKVFGYFLSSWGLNYDLREYGESGKWACCKGPGEFYNGGTWLSVIKSSTKTEGCKDIIKYFTTNEDFLTKWAKKSGDFMNNRSVMNAIKDDFSEAFLGGQNHFKLLYDVAENIDGSLLTAKDSIINGYFKSCASRYALGDFSKAETIQEIKDSVADKFASITVE